MNRWRHAIVLAVGACAWCSVLMLRLWSVNQSFWVARDDAVITLSHARNAAQFGSIGVSPGGDRVEGFSSPLQFGVAYIIQLVGTPGYRTITFLILISGVLLAGVAVTAMFDIVARQAGVADHRRSLLAVGLATFAAVGVAASWTSVGWIGSGMENPLVIATGCIAVLAALLAQESRAGQILLMVSLALFMLSRVEFAALSIPLVGSAAWLAASARPASRRRIALVVTLGGPLLAVALVHLARRLYFGEWLPNTAFVQDRSTGFDQIAAIGLVTAALLALLGLAIVRSEPMRTERRTVLSLGLTIGATVCAAAFVWMNASGRTAGSILNLLLLQPLVPLLITVAVLLQLQRIVDNTPWLPNHVFAALVAVPLSQYVITGPARLDDYRIAVIAVPFLVLWVVALTLHLSRSIRVNHWPTPSGVHSARAGLMGVASAVAVAAAGWVFVTDEARALNYEITGAPVLIDVGREVRSERLDDEGLVILATPDLGKVSFDKSAIIVDLGLLGDPLLTRISGDHPELVSTYLQHVARPDVWQTHSGWSCKYGEWIDSADFAESYELSDDVWLTGRPSAADCLLDGRWAVWTRTDASSEYALTLELMRTSDPAELVGVALEACRTDDGGVFRCQPVRRALQRAAASLRSSGRFSAAVDAMGASPSATLDVPLLDRGPGWARDASAAFVELAS